MTDDLAYNERIAELVEFSEREGHCNAPKSYSQLGTWVNKQRREYKKFKAEEPSTMTTERVKALKTVGFEFDPREADWKEKLVELDAFRQLKGHCNVPQRYAENKALANWVKNSVRSTRARNLLVSRMNG